MTATIDTNIDIDRLDKSGLRGTELLDFARDVLKYDGIKLLHTAIYAGVPCVNHIYFARMVGRAPATVRGWHCKSSGPIQAKMVKGRPYWFIKDIRKIFNE